MNTIIGIICGVACVVICIMTSGHIIDFWDPSSVFIVLGGTAFATLASFSFDRLKQALSAVKVAFSKETINLREDVEYIIKIANVARRDGVLALEELTEDLEDPFFKKVIMLVVIGSDPELIQSVLDTELNATKSRHAATRTVMDSAAVYSTSFGMCGTLIGLINMLRSLDSMDTLGSSMAVALVTTFYGCILANLVFNPLSKRLKAVGLLEYTRKELILEGVLAIQNGENSRIIREKLNSFLSAKQLAGDISSKQATETKEERRK